MSLLYWFIHEDKSYEFLTKLIGKEKVELINLNNYSRLLHDKIVKSKEKDLDYLKKSIGLEKDCTKYSSLIIDEINSIIRILSRIKNPLLAKFSDSERKRIISIKSRLKKLKTNLSAQKKILGQENVNHQNWDNLIDLIKKEAIIILDLENDSKETYKKSLEIKNKFFPEKVNFISIESVKKIHLNCIRKWGGLEGIRDLRLLESAVNRPKQGTMNEYLYPSIYEKSAALLFSIVQNQPFIDGNTRASVYSTIEFLKMNGIKTIDEKKIWFLAKKLSNKKYQNISYISHELIQLAA